VTVIIVATACVGRERELDELARRCAATATRGTDFIAVVGEPGIGKSVLLHRLVERHREMRGEQHGGAAWWANAAAWEADVPAALLRQLLQEEVPAEPVGAAAHFADRMTGPGPDAATAEAPALVVVDDAEHADPVSLHALATAARRHRDLPLLVVIGMTARHPLLGDIVSDELRLEGLDAAAVAELAALRGRILHPAMAEVLTRHTRGNPRDVLALLDELPASVWSRTDSALPAPSHVVAEVDLQLKRCGPEGRALVEAFAILGEGESLGEAARLAGLEDPLGAIDEAAEAGLLARWSEFEPRLRNPLTRAAVVGLMGVRAAGEAHHRAAKIVADPVRRLGHRVAATPPRTPPSPTTSTDWPASGARRAPGRRRRAFSAMPAGSPPTRCCVTTGSPGPSTPSSRLATASARARWSPPSRVCARHRCATRSWPTWRSSAAERPRRRSGCAARGTL